MTGSAYIADKGVEDAGLRLLILEKARSLLVADGYRRLSMRRLAREIGYSPTSIYLYFKNKDALFHSLIEVGMDLLRARLEAAFRAAGPDASAKVAALSRAYLTFAVEEPEYYEIMFALQADHLDRFPRDKYRRARRNLELMIETLKQGAEEGSLNVPDPDLAGAVIWAQLHGAVSLAAARRFDADLPIGFLFDACIEAVMKSLYPSPISDPEALSSSLFRSHPS